MDPYDALPSADALANSERHYGGDSPNVLRAGRGGAAAGGGSENSARRGLAAFANLKARLGQISRGRVRDPEPPRNKDYYYGSGMQRLAVPVPPLEDIYEDEERRFAAELYVSSLSTLIDQRTQPMKWIAAHIT